MIGAAEPATLGERMPQQLASLFIDLTWTTAIQVIFLGFIGGTLRS